MQAGSNGNRAGGGGTQSSGGRGGDNGGTFWRSQLQGGQGAAGGGGGYYGGGGGQYINGCCADGAGGGGSGFLSSQLIKEGSILFFWLMQVAVDQLKMDTFKIDRVSIVKQIVVEASGVNTPTLTLTTQDSNFGGVVRCVLTADNVQNPDGRLESNPVSYEVVDLRPIVKLEAYTF